MTDKWIWFERITKIILSVALLFNFGYVFSHTRLDQPNILNQMASTEWYRNFALALFILGFLSLLATLVLRKRKASLSCFALVGGNLLMLAVRM